MSSLGSKLSTKERIGYEVFLFTGLYGLYNLFFSNPIIADAVVFCILFGSLFVRYHIVVSGDDPTDSRAVKATGTLMFCGGVTIVSYLVFQVISILTANLGGGINQYLTLASSIILGGLVLAVVNLPVFRDDSQRRKMLKEELGEGGVSGLIARIGLFFDREVERSNYGLDKDKSPLENMKKVNNLVRQGEVGSENRGEFRRAIELSRDVMHIFTVTFHAFVSVVLLLTFAVLAEVYTSIKGIEMLSIIILVSAIYYSFLLLNLRFGLRREVHRSFWMMPTELILCIILTHFALFNGGLMGSQPVIILVPFILYLLSNWGGLISQKVIVGLMKRLVSTPDGYRDAFQKAMEKND